MLRVTLLVMALAAAPAAAQETISVTGNGHANVVPDRVAFTAGVQTLAETVEAAINQNSDRVSKIIAALKAAGADEKEIQTARFSIFPQQDQRAGSLPRIVGYQVSNTITARSDKVADAGRLLQAAVKAGANTVSSLRFELSDPAKGRDEALRAAFADARAQALVLAQAAGRPLGNVLRITEQPHAGAPPQPYARAMLGAEAATEVPVTPGTQEVVYSVSVTIALR
jgi:uncharacterized protein YggE